MAKYYNKDELKRQLEIENIFDLITELGGEPEYVDSGIVSQTICHNLPGEGSRKLYYYSNSKLFRCYTSCDEAFDVFELVIKAIKIQKNLDWELYDAMVYIAQFFGLAAAENTQNKGKENQYWAIFQRHDFSLPELRPAAYLKSYDLDILKHFSYPRILSWEQEGISPEVIKTNFIGYYAGGEQITIPHFDINNRLVGIRGRFLAAEDAERYGKYRPLKVNNQLYNHPLSMNLYNLNKTKNNIKKNKVAIIFESEKSTMQYRSYFGPENDISVACCGSSISNYQIDLLDNLGVQEIVIAFDRQFKEIGDDEFYRLKKKLVNIYNKYKNRFKITAIFDKKLLSPYKSSPTDVSKELFEQLLAERIIPNC